MSDYDVGPNDAEEELRSQSEEEEELEAEEEEDTGLFAVEDIQDEEYQDADADAHVDDDPLRTPEGLQRESYHQTDRAYADSGEGGQRSRPMPVSAEGGRNPLAEGSGPGRRTEEFVPAQPLAAGTRSSPAQAGEEEPLGGSLPDPADGLIDNADVAALLLDHLTNMPSYKSAMAEVAKRIREPASWDEWQRWSYDISAYADFHSEISRAPGASAGTMSIAWSSLMTERFGAGWREVA